MYQFLAITTPKLAYLGISKYTWNPKQNIFIRKTGNESKNVHFNQLILLLWIFYTFSQLIRMYLLKDYDNFIFAFVILIALFVALESFSITIWRATEWNQMINSLLIYLRHIQSKILIFLKTFQIFQVFKIHPKLHIFKK